MAGRGSVDRGGLQSEFKVLAGGSLQGDCHADLLFDVERRERRGATRHAADDHQAGSQYSASFYHDHAVSPREFVRHFDFDRYLLGFSLTHSY